LRIGRIGIQGVDVTATLVISICWHHHTKSWRQLTLCQHLRIMTVPIDCPIHTSKKTIWRHNRLELHAMGSFVTAIHQFLIIGWTTCTAQSPINETPDIVL
jgi:hypothetical protein